MGIKIKMLALLLLLSVSNVVWSDNVKLYEDEKLYTEIIKDNTEFSYQYYLNNCTLCTHKKSVLIQLENLKNDDDGVQIRVFDSRINNKIHTYTKTDDGNHYSHTWITNNSNCINVKSEFTNRSNLTGHTYQTFVKFMDKDNNIIKSVEQKKGVDAKFFGSRRVKNTVSGFCLPGYLFTNIAKAQIRHDLPSENLPSTRFPSEE